MGCPRSSTTSMSRSKTSLSSGRFMISRGEPTALGSPMTTQQVGGDSEQPCAAVLTISPLSPTGNERRIRLDRLVEGVRHDVVGQIPSHTTSRVRVDRWAMSDVHRVHRLHRRHQLIPPNRFGIGGPIWMRRCTWHSWYLPAADRVFTDFRRRDVITPDPHNERTRAWWLGFCHWIGLLVELKGIEPLTSSLRTTRSTN